MRGNFNHRSRIIRNCPNLLAMSWFKEIIKNKKKALAKRSEGFLTALAKSCVYAWDDPDELDKILQESLNMLPYCHLIFAVNIKCSPSGRNQGQA